MRSPRNGKTFPAVPSPSPDGSSARTICRSTSFISVFRAPLRQLVHTLPFELRARLAFDGELCGEVCRTFVDSV
ncbi:MAG: hypothetical protein JW751_16085, partial [Polyangiaceae bacterium]|nr:hypothetical protein [Polyangiaceae bacterium]